MTLQVWTWQLIKRKSNFTVSKFNLSKTDKRVVSRSLKISLPVDNATKPSSDQPQRSRSQRFYPDLRYQSSFIMIEIVPPRGPWMVYYFLLDSQIQFSPQVQQFLAFTKKRSE